MLQQQFENYDYTPLLYDGYMDNMHVNSGNGWYGMSLDKNYSNRDTINVGNGWTFLGGESINYNLIFQC